MRSAILVLVAIATVGCAGHAVAPLPGADDALTTVPSERPLVRVSVGEVTGLVPSGWVAASLAPTGPEHGFVASPRPHPFLGQTPRSGLTASWVDATEVGVPSDYFYMAATGPLLGEFFDDDTCTVTRTSVFVDREPGFMAGHASSPGDFIASGHGTCITPGGYRHRWAYFVAAPGFGPARAMGITRSGLYVAAAVTRAAPGASGRLHRLLGNIRFGGERIDDFVRAVQAV